jgi:hypothetical protein
MHDGETMQGYFIIYGVQVGGHANASYRCKNGLPGDKPCITFGLSFV